MPISISLRLAVRAIVRYNPTLSIDKVLRALRRDGYKISNSLGRALVKTERIKLQDFIKSRSTDKIVGNTIPLGRDVREFRGRLRENVLRNLIRVQPQFEGVSDRSSLGGFRYVRIYYRARAQTSIYMEGRLIQRRVISKEGRVVQNVKDFTVETITDLVVQQIEGQITIDIGNEFNLGSGSVIDGLTVEIDNMTLDIRGLEGRG